MNDDNMKPQPDSVPPQPAPAANAEGAAEAATSTAAAPADPLAEALERARALEDQMLRARADFDNFRKRTLREREEWTQRSIENLVRDLLPVVDNFDIGLDRARADGTPETLLEGFRLTVEQLAQALRKYGLEPVDAVQAAFDPLLHEAIHHAPSPDVPAGTILMQARKGYKLGARTLRPAQVVVSSGPPAPTPAKEG